MDICPFCGKAFKRLKSHLPHCKMAKAREEARATEHAQKNPTEAKAKKHSEVKGDGRADKQKQKLGNKNEPRQDHVTFLSHKAQAKKKSKILSGDKVTSPKQNNVNSLKHDQLSMDQDKGNQHMILPKEDRSKHLPVKGHTAPTILESPEIDVSVEASQIQITEPLTPVNQTLTQKVEPSRKHQHDHAKSSAHRIKPVEVGPIHEEVSESSTPFIHVLPEGPELLNALVDSVTLRPNHHLKCKQVVNDTLKKMEHGGEGSPRYKEVSNITEHGEDHRMDTVDQSSVHSDDVKKEGNRSYWPTILERPKVVMAQVEVGQNHEKGTDTPTSVIQATSGRPKSSKQASEDKGRPKIVISQVEVGQNHEKGTDTPTSVIQATSGSPKSLKLASEDKGTVMWTKHLMEHKQDLDSTRETKGGGGEGSPTYGGTRSAEFRVRGADHLNVAIDLFKGPSNQELRTESKSGSAFLLTTQVSAPFGPSNHVLQGVPAAICQAPETSLAPTGSVKALEGTKKSMENDLTRHGNLPRRCSLGLQYIPELYSNYIQLKIVPGKWDQSGMDWRTGKAIMAEEANAGN